MTTEEMSHECDGSRLRYAIARPTLFHEWRFIIQILNVVRHAEIKYCPFCGEDLNKEPVALCKCGKVSRYLIHEGEKMCEECYYTIQIERAEELNFNAD